jgi:hypothetical protein
VREKQTVPGEGGALAGDTPELAEETEGVAVEVKSTVKP